MKTQKQLQSERDIIIFGKESFLDNYSSFTNLPLEKLDQLISNNLIDLQSTQNDSPAVEEFYEFMKKYPKFTCHGYVIKNRPDHRVSLEGVTFRGTPTIEMISNFADLFRHADDFIIQEDNLFCWFD